MSPKLTPVVLCSMFGWFKLLVVYPRLPIGAAGMSLFVVGCRKSVEWGRKFARFRRSSCPLVCLSPPLICCGVITGVPGRLSFSCLLRYVCLRGAAPLFEHPTVTRYTHSSCDYCFWCGLPFLSSPCPFYGTWYLRVHALHIPCVVGCISRETELLRASKEK